jgi:hypothetical protein
MDTLYTLPKSAPSATPSVQKIITMAFVFVFTLMSVFYLPIDIASIQMSMDPGFTGFFVIVVTLFALKIASLTLFYFVLFDTSSIPIIPTYLRNSIIYTGFSMHSAALTVVVIEIWMLTQSIIAIISHPFVLDFGVFVFTCSLVITQFYWPGSNTQGYMIIPQQVNTAQPEMISEMQIINPFMSQKSAVKLPEMPKPVQPVPPVVEEPKVEVAELKQPEPPMIKQPEYPSLEVPEEPKVKLMMDPRFPMFEPIVDKVPMKKKPMFQFVPYYVAGN